MTVEGEVFALGVDRTSAEEGAEVVKGGCFYLG
jgi:hypothetical protein